jgi:hypothetical protein
VAVQINSNAKIHPVLESRTIQIRLVKVSSVHSARNCAPQATQTFIESKHNDRYWSYGCVWSAVFQFRLQTMVKFKWPEWTLALSLSLSCEAISPFSVIQSWIGSPSDDSWMLWQWLVARAIRTHGDQSTLPAYPSKFRSSNCSLEITRGRWVSHLFLRPEKASLHLIGWKFIETVRFVK